MDLLNLSARERSVRPLVWLWLLVIVAQAQLNRAAIPKDPKLSPQMTQNFLPYLTNFVFSNLISRVENTETSSQQTRQRFLYYFAHSGFSNQLIGLSRAAQLAYTTNRTLIVPPILPHFGGDPIFPIFKGRAAGAKCVPYARSPQSTKMAREDAVLCMDAMKKNINPPYAAFTEILDFERLKKDLGVNFIELHEFVKTEPSLVETYFSAERPAPKVDLDGTCLPRKPSREYPHMVHRFQSVYQHDIVAVIPSAFRIKNTNDMTKLFQNRFNSFPLSLKLARLVQSIYNQIPSSDYVSVHVRFEDGVKFVCDTENKDWLFAKLLNQTDWSHHVYFASSSSEASSCYKGFLTRSGFPTSTLESLLSDANSNSTMRGYMEAIQVQKKTLLLVMDQILVALGKHLILDNYIGFSTFQHVVRYRHKLRLETLQDMTRPTTSK